MPTIKKRINVTLPDNLEVILKTLAERDNVPVATKATELIKQAIELDEDGVLNELAESRDDKNAKFLSHKDVWK